MIGLGASLLSLLFGRVILPLRQLAAADGPGPTSPVPSPPPAEEIQALCANIHSLRSDLAGLSALLTESRSQLTNCQHLASVGKLAACLAHEIRNPLTSMKMWAFAIRREAGEHPELQNKSLMLAREISRLQHLLMNYLDFARPPQPRQTRLGVVALIDETLELLDHRIARGHLRVVRGNGVRVPPVLADAQQLKQVFLNILDNAADAMPEGGEIRITPSVEIGPDGRTMVILRFQDTGPGLPPAVRDRLFVPFVSTKERGTGLGLSIAAGIVANHGGQLALESSSPQGTTFAVRLPSWTREDQQA
jgi:signal transduction histidine kinase